MMQRQACADEFHVGCGNEHVVGIDVRNDASVALHGAYADHGLRKRWVHGDSLHDRTCFISLRDCLRCGRNPA